MKLVSKVLKGVKGIYKIGKKGLESLRTMRSYLHSKVTGPVTKSAEFTWKITSLGCNQPLTSGLFLPLLRLSVMIKEG